MNALITDKNEVELINIKFQNFKLFSPIFEKMKLYADDEELIKVFNYLFNSIYVLFNSEKNKRNYHMTKFQVFIKFNVIVNIL